MHTLVPPQTPEGACEKGIIDPLCISLPGQVIPDAFNFTCLWIICSTCLRVLVVGCVCEKPGLWSVTCKLGHAWACYLSICQDLDPENDRTEWSCTNGLPEASSLPGHSLGLDIVWQ